MILDIHSTLMVYKEMTFCCLSTMVYHSCVLKDGVSVWNNGKSQCEEQLLENNVMKWNSQVMKNESHSKSPKQDIKTEQEQVMKQAFCMEKDYVCFLRCNGGGQCFTPWTSWFCDLNGLHVFSQSCMTAAFCKAGEETIKKTLLESLEKNN